MHVHIHFLLLVIILKNYFCLAKKKPHILMLVADDWGWNDYSLHGADQIPTKNIDALAASGILLNNYYTMPLCTPSRAALMTGMHPANIGMQHDVLNPGEPWGLPLNLKTLPQYLKDDCYKTYAVGKWHLGDFRKVYTPTQRGFDSHFGYWEGRQDYMSHMLKEKLYNIKGYDMRRDLNVSWDSFNKYATDLFTEETINLIRSHNVCNPMFLYVAHLAVHAGNFDDPVQAPANIVEMFSYIKDEKRRMFAAMVWKLDDSIGKIISALGNKNMLQNTIIVLTTDNGGAVSGYDNSIGSNWPLRGSKGTLWEGGVRGNAIIWSTDLPSPKISINLMHIKDWVPTLLAAVNSIHLCQGELRLDGYNMWPVLKGTQNTSYDELLLNKDPIQKTFAYRSGDFKIVHENSTWSSWYIPTGRLENPPYNYSSVIESSVAQTFRTLGYYVPSIGHLKKLRQRLNIKCLLPYDNSFNFTYSCGKSCGSYDICLFNLKTDPCETNNLADKMPNIFLNMLWKVMKTNFSMPLNKPWDERSNPKFWNGTFTYWCDFIAC